MPRVDAPRTRRSFARLNKVLDVPNLIDIQRKSFDWLVDPETGGLRETIDDISPIEDYTGHLAVNFGEFHFDEPAASIDECREKDLTYSRPLTVTVAFINHETGEIREQSVFMGDFPWMTERGTFIINGTERVVVTQLVRSPGAYLMEPKDREKQVFTANLMPARGSWLELEIDKKGKVFVRIDRKRKLPVTVLLRAMTYNPETDGSVEETHEDIERLDQELLDLFDDSLYIRNTIESDPENTQDQEGRADRAVQEAAPRRAAAASTPPTRCCSSCSSTPSATTSRASGATSSTRASDLDIDLDTRTLTHDDIHALVRELVNLPKAPRDPRGRRGRDQGLRGRGRLDAARAGRRAPRRVRALRQPPPAHGRRADPGGLPHRPLPHGARRPRAPDHRGRGHDHAADDRQHPPGRGRAEGVLRLQPARQFMDQTNSLSGLTHRRRLSALGAGGLTRERAPIEVRDVHPTHYGRMCPIETPEGPNIGLIGSLSSYAEVSEHGFVTTPYRVVEDGLVTDKVVHLDATQEEERLIAQANHPIDEKTGKLKGPDVVCRTLAGQYVTVPPKDVDLMDVSPEQIWSVATAMIPFLEHDDANRALMGSNMQRQAVPLLETDAPIIGTGMERRAALDTGDVAAGAQRRARSPTSTRLDRGRDQGRPRTSTSCRSSCAPTRAR